VTEELWLASTELASDQTMPLHDLDLSEPTSEDKVDQWNIYCTEDLLEDGLHEGEEPDSSDEVEDPLVAIFDQILLDLLASSEYQTLISRLNTIFKVDWSSGPELLIMERKLQDLMRFGVSQTAPKGSISIHLETDIMGFFQYYGGHDAMAAIKSVLVLVGTLPRVQAVTCIEYAQQIWPARGSDLLTGFQTAIDCGESTCKHHLTFLMFIANQRSHPIRRH
jgi:hypothetical protein